MICKVQTLALCDEEILRLIAQLYRKRFFRKRPEPTSQLLATLRQSFLTKPNCLKLFFLWGVHGKGGMSADDYQAMDFLTAFLAHVSFILSARADLTVVVCDTHGAVNRVDPIVAEAYVKEIVAVSENRGWNTVRMSSLWQRAGISLEIIDASSFAMHGDGQLERLIEFAKKYYRDSDSEEGARRYRAARLIERPLLTELFRGCIHVTSADPSLSYLQPNLPEFFVWSIRQGCSAKPWFKREMS